MSTSTRGDCGCGGQDVLRRGQALGSGLDEIRARTGKALQGSAGVGQQLLGSAVEAWQPVLSAWWRLVSEALQPRGGHCAVPETGCPPSCVGRLELRASRKEPAVGMVKVTNTDRVARNFTFEAESFHGPSGDTGVKAAVEPAAAPLAPDQSVVVKVVVPPDAAFEPGTAYQGRLLVRGAYEQCVCLELQICTRTTPSCEVAQGPIPRRVRAHHWYDHFQCEEPCFEPTPERVRSPKEAVTSRPAKG